MREPFESGFVFVDRSVEGLEGLHGKALLIFFADVDACLPKRVDEGRIGSGIRHRLNKNLPHFGVGHLVGAFVAAHRIRIISRDRTTARLMFQRGRLPPSPFLSSVRIDVMRCFFPALVASVAILGASSCQRANRANHIAHMPSAAPTNEVLPEVPDFLGVRVPNRIIHLTPAPTGPTLCADTTSIQGVIHVGCAGGNSGPEELGILTVVSVPAKVGLPTGDFPEGS